jgi:hypothetical protein
VDSFADAQPDRFNQAGIASLGFRPWLSSFGVFFSQRALDWRGGAGGDRRGTQRAGRPRRRDHRACRPGRRVERIGFANRWPKSGSNDFLLDKHGLSPARVAERIRAIAAVAVHRGRGGRDCHSVRISVLEVAWGGSRRLRDVGVTVNNPDRDVPPGCVGRHRRGGAVPAIGHKRDVARGYDLYYLDVTVAPGAAGRCPGTKRRDRSNCPLPPTQSGIYVPNYASSRRAPPVGISRSFHFAVNGRLARPARPAISLGMRRGNGGGPSRNRLSGGPATRLPRAGGGATQASGTR